MDGGWIKLYRKVIENGWIRSHNLFIFWIWCLLKATHKPMDILVGNIKVHLEPGDFVFGLKVASKETGLSIRAVRTCRDNLVTLQNLTIKSTNKFSIGSVINWSIYQSEENQIDKQTDTLPTSNRQATDNKQEVKNIKKKTLLSYSDPLFLKFWEEYPKNGGGKKPAYQVWKRISPDNGLVETIMKSLDLHKRVIWKDREPDKIPHAVTWLNQQRWEVEIPKQNDGLKIF